MKKSEWKEQHRKVRLEAWAKPFREAAKRNEEQRAANLQKNWQVWTPYVHFGQPVQAAAQKEE